MFSRVVHPLAIVAADPDPELSCPQPYIRTTISVAPARGDNAAAVGAVVEAGDEIADEVSPNGVTVSFPE
jgi:hypothetical protein